MAPQTVLVIPCYNEAKRLNFKAFEELLRKEGVELLFVDDGSTDFTSADLAQFCSQHSDRASLLTQPTNQGKATAVRKGLLKAVDKADIVGFADADLATPPEELFRLADLLNAAPKTVNVVIGSRIKRLGSIIDRSLMRHLCGRVFATFASLTLGVGVYDTQCGAKFFRNTASFRRALEKPFITRWIFDVELLGRLIKEYDTTGTKGVDSILEVPLDIWIDVSGSKINFWTGVFSVLSLAKVYRDLKRPYNTQQ